MDTGVYAFRLIINCILFDIMIVEYLKAFIFNIRRNFVLITITTAGYKIKFNGIFRRQLV